MLFLPQIKTQMWDREMAEQGRDIAYLKYRCGHLTCVFMGVSRDDAPHCLLSSRRRGVATLIEVHYFSVSKTGRDGTIQVA